MKEAQVLLQLLTERLPPDPPERKHVLLLEGGKLKLSLALCGKWHLVNFDEGDLDKGGAALADEIATLCAGIGMGPGPTP